MILVLSLGSLFIFCLSAQAAPAIRIVSPKDPHFAGQPLLFHIQTLEFLQPASATLFFRPVGVQEYRAIEMNPESPIDFKTLIRGQKAVPPGVQFFFRIEDGKGRRFFFPDNEPRRFPYTLNIRLDRNPPRILGILPGEGDLLTERRPLIRVAFEDTETWVQSEWIRIALDGTDVTQLARISETEIAFQPEEDLTDGPHTVTVDLIDACGNRMGPVSWGFTIQGEKPVQISGEVRWDAEAREKFEDRERNTEIDWAVQSSMGVSTLLETEQMATAFDASAWYTEEQGEGPLGDPFSLNQFLWQIQAHDQYAAAGDVEVEGTELISSRINRRGGLAALNFFDTQMELFALRSNTITGFEQGLGIGKGDQRIVGGSVKKSFLKEALSAKITYLRGRDEQPGDYNAGSLQGATRGDVYSVLLAGNLLEGGLSLEGEYCGSRFDDDLADDLEQESDHAWRVRLFGTGETYDWSAGYRYLGPFFRSIANPSGQRDVQEALLDGGLRYGPADLRLTLFHNQDNVEEDPLMPVIRNSTGTLCLTLNKAGWPGITLSETASSQDSAQEPDAFLPLENRTYSTSLAMVWEQETWGISPAYTFTRFDDKDPTVNNDTRSHVANLSAGYRPVDWFSLNPSLSYERLFTDFDGVTSETWQGALGGVVTFLDRMVDLNLSLSILDTRSDDHSLHTTTFSGIGQVNWNLEQFLLETGYQTFSIRSEYNRTRDHLSDEAIDDYAVYAVFSIGIPIQFPF